MASDPKSSMVKIKPISGGSTSNPKIDSFVIKKKVLDSSTKPKSTTITATKPEVKAKSTSSTSKATTKKSTVKTRDKKVFSLPDQKYDPPEEREPFEDIL